MDYTTNGTFPTTLALANNGKGIAPGQAVDNIIYVPDNTSNPNNFCLQYRIGANTYAVDNNSQPTKGVCLSNLVGNGNFAIDSNSDGYADNWSSASSTPNIASPSVSNNIQYWTPTVGNAWSSSTQTGSPSGAFTLSNTFGHMYYIKAVVSNIAQFIWWGSDGNIVSLGVTGSSGLVSGIRTSNSNASNARWIVYANIAGTQSSISYVLSIDLTATYGAGNEPTKAQMDTIMSSYPNNWFNIVAKVNL
jgi:hypothetical protein